MYTPYSIRNNITDSDVAGLLDFLEREMGWEIKYKEYRSSGMIGISNGISIDINNIPLRYTEEYIVNMSAYGRIIYMPKELFFKTYKTLLPVIRNLYSK